MRKIGVRAILFILFLLIPSGAAAANIRVAILPFQVNSADSLDFLREGMVDMLASRLGQMEQVTIVDKIALKRVVSFSKNVKVSADLLSRIGKETGANFLIAGSLTKLGRVISIDATIYKIPVSQPFSAIFLQGEGLESLPAKVNYLADRIRQELTDGITQSSALPGAVPQAGAETNTEYLLAGHILESKGPHSRPKGAIMSYGVGND